MKRPAILGLTSKACNGARWKHHKYHKYNEHGESSCGSNVVEYIYIFVYNKREISSRLLNLNKATGLIGGIEFASSTGWNELEG